MASTMRSVVEQLQGAIRDGRLVPGQRLVEVDLTRQLGVSRGPLREAFAHLAAEGLLEITPHRGAVVRSLDRDELVELFEMREVLEGEAARLAARRIGEGDHRARFAEGWERIRSVAVADPVAYADANERFHDLIVELSGNRRLVHHVEMLRLQVFRLQFRRAMEPGTRERSMADHEVVARTILAGDEEGAAAAMRDHVRRGGVEADRLLERVGRG